MISRRERIYRGLGLQVCDMYLTLEIEHGKAHATIGCQRQLKHPGNCFAKLQFGENSVWMYWEKMTEEKTPKKNKNEFAPKSPDRLPERMPDTDLPKHDNNLPDDGTIH